MILRSPVSINLTGNASRRLCQPGLGPKSASKPFLVHNSYWRNAGRPRSACKLQRSVWLGGNPSTGRSLFCGVAPFTVQSCLPYFPHHTPTLTMMHRHFSGEPSFTPWLSTDPSLLPSLPVKDMVAGRTFHRPTGGFVGVANVGMDANWLGSPLAVANLYGFGRLAWYPNLRAEKIADEWTRLSFGSDPLVVSTLTSMQLSSWHVYDGYTGPLGVGDAHLRPGTGVVGRKRLGTVAPRRS